ncbi:MAG: protein kinase [Pseudomonadota bacterium]|nr:protein kinase [Pseudomonadota bacterium]
MPVTSDGNRAEVDRWVGRSGRVYVLEPGGCQRDGGMASILRVLPQGAPNGVSTVPEGLVLALKIASPDDRLASEAIAREVETFVALSRAPGSPPCPRLYDIVGSPVVGLVMEWCPTDMERWWEATWSAPRSFVELAEAMADICRRVREYEAVAELELGKRVIHADIKPRNVLRGVDSRWLLTDFGASKSRSVEDTSWVATRMILGTENFIAPEALFNARKPHPAAMDTWSLGCSFFALLRMRAILRGGGKMPANGTHAHLFRTNRVALIGDLQQRKPALFVDKDIDPSHFASPERLPEKDRRAVAEALEGVFGASHPTLEGVLATETLHLLDRALRIDPALRFRDPLEMAGEFEALAQRYRELALRAAGGASRVPGGTAPATAAHADPFSSAPGLATAGGPAPDASKAGASAPRMLVSEDIVVDEGSGRRGAGASGHGVAARVPPWIGVALLAVLGLQVVQIGVSSVAIALSLRAAPAPSLAPSTERGPLAIASVAAAPEEPAAASPLAALLGGTPAETVGSGESSAVLVEPARASASEPLPPAGSGAPAARAEPSAAGAQSKPSDIVPKRIGTPPPANSGTASGVILVSGGQAFLMGAAGQMSTGSVAPGSYELYAQTRPNGEFESLGTVAVGSGERIIYKCGLGTCRRLP